MDVRLVVETGEREGQEIPIDSDELVIGRDRSCQRRIIDHQVSPRHCRVLRDGDRVSVEDLGSATGTEVNGRPISTAEVRHGDRLRVGSESFRIAIAAGADDAAGRVRARVVDGGWAKLCVTESRGIAVVGFADIALINDMEIREVGRELDGLIERGHNRIALDFDNVVRLSSQVIGMVLNAHRRCTADGGTVKICQIHPDLREIFALTGVFLTIDIYPDVRSALESDWPKPSPRRPSPAALPAPPRKNGPGVPRPRHGVGDEAHPQSAADGRRSTVDGDEAYPGVDWSFRRGRDLGTDQGATGSKTNSCVDAPDSMHGFADGPVTPSTDFAPREEPIDLDEHPVAPDIPLPVIPLDDDVSPAEPGALAPLSSGGARPATIPEAGAPPRRDLGAAARPAPIAASPARADGPPSRPGGAVRRVRLIAMVGRAQGQAVEISAPRFLIGRDLSCHLRAVSPIVSRFHALIEQRGGQVFLRDLGSSNGTRLGDQSLQRFEEVEVSGGELLQIGPMRFTFAIEPVAVPSPAVAPISSAPPGVLSHDPHLSPLIQCPQCGIDGWISIDQLLLAIGRALSQPPSTEPTLVSLLQAPVSPGPAAPTPRLSPEVPPSPPVPGMPRAHRNGHTPSPPATTRSGTANGSGPGRVGVLSGGAGPHALQPEGDGMPAPASMPRRHLAPPPVEVPVAAAAEDDEPGFLDALDLLPYEVSTTSTEELETRSLPAPLTPRSLDIDFHCPECGAEGWIPVDQLDRQFQCRACHAKLYTDPSGGLLVGNISERPRSPNAFEDEPDLLGRAIARWQALPRLVQTPLAGVAALLLVALIGWFMSAPTLPATLKDRGIFVAEAFAHEDYRRLRAIAAPGSSREVSRWMEQVRPRFWRGKIRRVSVRVNIQQQNKKTGKAVLKAHLVAVTGGSPAGTLKRPASPTLEISPGPAASTTAPEAGPDNRKIDLNLYWVMNRGQWLLDGTRTRAASQPPGPATSPTRAPKFGLE